MEVQAFLEAMHVAQRLKDTTRHCYTTGGRHESVAEHSWRIALMAFFLRDEFSQADMDRVIKMCLIHDLGEAFTGDIPSFLKTDTDEDTEQRLLYAWTSALPQPVSGEMLSLYQEMRSLETPEARIYKALDNLEALIQHNESDIGTWLENEYALNLTYGDDKVGFSPYLRALRQCIREETQQKIQAQALFSVPGKE